MHFYCRCIVNGKIKKKINKFEQNCEGAPLTKKEKRENLKKKKLTLTAKRFFKTLITRDS